MPKYSFTRPGTYEYPGLQLRISNGDVVQLDSQPDAFFTAVADAATVTVVAGAPGGAPVPTVPADGSLLAFDGTERQFEPRTAAEAGLATQADLAAERALQGATYGPFIVNPADVGFSIGAAAGQSNDDGQAKDWDTTYRRDPSDPRVWQFRRTAPNAGKLALAIEPTGSVNKGPALPFGRELVAGLPPNRKYLEANYAVGGSGFHPVVGSSPYTWTPGSHPDGITNLYDALVAHVRAALAAAGPNARVEWLRWVGGEHDGPFYDQAGYTAEMLGFIDAFRAEFANPDLIVVIGQMAKEWIADNPTAVPINAAHIDIPRLRTRTAFAFGPPLGYVNTDRTHYNSDGQDLAGASMARAARRAVYNVLGTAPVVPAAPRLTQSGTTVGIAWDQVDGRVTDWVVETSLNGGAFAALSRTSPDLDVAATLTGVAAGSTVAVRIRSVNEQGTSAASPTSSLTTVAAPGQVTGLAVQSGTSSSAVPLAWTAKAGATSYLVEVKKASDSTWTAYPTVTGTVATVNDLDQNTAYNFRVSAVNAGGTGAPSSTVSQTTLTAPTILGIQVQASHAYSMHKINPDYAGPCLRVRDTTTNTETDIGFDGSGNLDQTALLAACPSGHSGTMVTWYDQSGNARDITQATTTRQPSIVNAGAVRLITGIRAAIFITTGTLLGRTISVAGLYANGSATVMAVVKSNPTLSTLQRVVSESLSTNTTTNYSPIMSDATTAASLSQDLRRDSGTDVLAPSPTTPVAFDGAIHQVSVVDTGAQWFRYIDGTLGGPVLDYVRPSTGMTPPDRFSVGAWDRSGGPASSFTSGYIAEVVCWRAVLTDTQRATAAASQKAYWGTP